MSVLTYETIVTHLDQEIRERVERTAPSGEPRDGAIDALRDHE